MEPKDPNFENKVRQSFQNQKFMTTLGADLQELSPGCVQIHMPYAESLTQQHGYVHAAAIAAIGDSACGYAALTLAPEGAAVLTVEYKVNLLAPARGETFVAYGRVLKPGRTLTVSQGEVFAQQEGQDKLVASLTATIMTLVDLGIQD